MNISSDDHSLHLQGSLPVVQAKDTVAARGLAGAFACAVSLCNVTLHMLV
jgi:hypothetical protein